MVLGMANLHHNIWLIAVIPINILNFDENLRKENIKYGYQI